MNFRTKLLAITVLPVILISVAALVLIDFQSRKLSTDQGLAVEMMIREAKQTELENYVKLARTAVDPFYQWDNVSRLQAQKQVAEIISRMTYGADGYFFISNIDGTVLNNPILAELDLAKKLPAFANEVKVLTENFDDTTHSNGEPYQYIWNKPSTQQSAEKIGQSVFLDNWDWVIGSGLYMDDITAQIGSIQSQLAENVQETRYVLLALAIGTVVLTSLLFAFVRFSEQKIADAQLKTLASEIVNAQENERKRVSTELHDGISQLLVSASYSLDTAATKLSKNSEAKESITKSVETISTAISEIRRISIALRPSILDDVGLAAAIKSLGNDFQSQTGIKTTVLAQNVGYTLDEREKTTLYRVAQEALANVAKHAQATSVKIKLSKDVKGITLQISDNGNGLSTTRDAYKISGMGLRNMEERVESHNGRFNIYNKRPSGVQLNVFLKGNKVNLAKETNECAAA